MRVPDLAAKVAFLSDPEAYPERPSMVETKETHMSWVFLTDAHAYKLKKPVRTGFLDFSTLAARSLNCRREVRLNRRLAPDVYLGVVALRTDAAGRLHLDAHGRIADWLVKSRRLAAHHTLEYAIQSGAVRQADIVRLVERLVPFFRDARRVPATPGAIWAALQPRSRSPPRAAASRISAAGGADRAARHGPTPVHRDGSPYRGAPKRADRRGHGDLRPEHIYLDGAPIVMDCIEFNRGLRILDPAEELAYLAMECDRLGAPDVDGWLLGAWRDATGEALPRPLVGFYKARQAMLRAKIAIWHLDEPLTDSAAKWRARARDYLHLAQGYAGALPRPVAANPLARAAR